MDSQYNNSLTTSASSLFDSQPQHIKDLLQGLQKGSSIQPDQSTKSPSNKKQNMAQWQYNSTLPTSSTQSNPDEYGSTGTVDSMYGSKAYGGSTYGYMTYGQPNLDTASFEGGSGNHGGQSYNESTNNVGWKGPGQSYYDGTSFQGEMGGYGYNNSMLGGGHGGTVGQGYNDKGGGRGGRGRGGRGRGRGGDTPRGRGGAKRGMLHGGQVSQGFAQGVNQESGGYDENTWGTGSQGSDSGTRGRGRGKMGFGHGSDNTRGRGSAKRGMSYGNQSFESSVRGRGRGAEGSTWGRGRGTEGRGRGSAKRGMPQGVGSGPAAKKPKWQNEQQETTGSNDQRWGAQQGWARARVWGGKNKEQGGRGRGSRGRPGGPSQRKNFGPSNKKFDDNAVEFGFDGKPVGPERFAKTFGEFKHCKICDVKINSVGCARDHYSGKLHLKKLDAYLKNEELMKTVDLSSGKCELCDVTYTSPQQIKSHLEGSKHKRNVEEAKAKAEGRPPPAESSPEKKKEPSHEKKKEGDTETDTADGKEKASSGPSEEGSAPENGNKKPERVRQKRKKKANDGETETGERKLFHCDLCGINTTSPELLECHFRGKKHKLTVENIERKNQTCTATSENTFSCELCHVTTTNAYTLNLHLIGKKHMKKLEATKPAQKPQPLVESSSCPPGQQEPASSELVNEPPLGPIDEELFESEKGLDNEQPPEGVDEIRTSIEHSLQETTAGMPDLQF